MKRFLLSAAAGAAFLAGSANAQGPGGMPPGRGPGAMMGGGPLRHEKPVTGAPYSADVSNQMSQTLNDGNTISHTTTGHVARDSQGRVYSQETISGGPFGGGPVTFTMIFDPVAGYSYRLNASNKTAIRRAIPTPGTRPEGAPPDGQHGPRPGKGPDADTVKSDLGTQTINGINATGVSRTRTIPAGMVGNAQPIVSTNEVWTSPDLQIVVLAKRNDPRMGQSVYSLTNIQRAEPPASLFQVPSDYTVTDAPKGSMHRGGPGDAPPPPPGQ